MGIVHEDLMRPINNASDHLDVIATLAELGPLLDERGAECFSHAVMLLHLTEGYAKRLGAEMDALIEQLRACQGVRP